MSPNFKTFLFIEWTDLENVLWCLFSRATFTLCCLWKPHFFLVFFETTMSSAEVEDGGLPPSLQLVDVVVLRAVTMMSVWPVCFEIWFQMGPTNFVLIIHGTRCSVRFLGQTKRQKTTVPVPGRAESNLGFPLCAKHQPVNVREGTPP